MAMAFREELRKAKTVLYLSEFMEPSVSGRNVDQAYKPQKAGCRKKTLDTGRAFQSHRAYLGAEGVGPTAYRDVGDSVEDVMRRLKGLQLFLNNVLSNEEFQAMSLKTRASLQRIALEERDRLEAQKKKRLAMAEQEAALQQQRLKEIAEFASKLMTLTGASMEPPWIKKLFEVAAMSLDPHDLLGVYNSAPEMLGIFDPKNPHWCWLPYVPKSKQELSALSRGAALEALVGKLGDGEKLLKGFLYTQNRGYALPLLSVSPLQFGSAMSRT